jgi:hypothetical protein
MRTGLRCDFPVNREKYRENGAKSRFSSEFVANLEKQTDETGSHLTASATTQSVIFHISRD